MFIGICAAFPLLDGFFLNGSNQPIYEQNTLHGLYQ